jgi:hypothetical protein
MILNVELDSLSRRFRSRLLLSKQLKQQQLPPQEDGGKRRRRRSTTSTLSLAAEAAIVAAAAIEHEERTLKHRDNDDDKASSSSTVTFDRRLERQGRSGGAGGGGGGIRKEVRFNLDKTLEIPSPTDWTLEEKNALCWYSATEYRHIRLQHAILSREVTQAEEKNKSALSYHRVLLSTYHKCCIAATAQDKELDKLPLSLQTNHTRTPPPVLTRDELYYLTRWAHVAPNRLGLEKWTLKTMQKCRQDRRQQLLEAVFAVQQRSRNYFDDSNHDDDDVNSLDSEYDEDEEILVGEMLTQALCQTSEKWSQPSRLFATTMAQAQALSRVLELEDQQSATTTTGQQEEEQGEQEDATESSDHADDACEQDEQEVQQLPGTEEPLLLL